jgi:hypothetical protein
MASERWTVNLTILFQVKYLFGELIVTVQHWNGQNNKEINERVVY